MKPAMTKQKSDGAVKKVLSEMSVKLGDMPVFGDLFWVICCVYVSFKKKS